MLFSWLKVKGVLSLLFTFLQCFIEFLVLVKNPKSYSSTPVETPLPDRKHCSSNASSVIPPLIWATSWHHTASPCRVIYALHETTDLAQLVLMMLPQACVRWPIREDWVFGWGGRGGGGGGGLKETGTKTDSELQHWTGWEKIRNLFAQNTNYEHEHKMCPLNVRTRL